MFRTTQTLDVRTVPGFTTPIAGQVGAGQEINVSGRVLLHEGVIWQEVEGGALWLPERRTDNSQTFMLWEGAGDPPRPASTPANLPPNIDIDPADYERTKRASFFITSAFEGSFSAYQTYDRGIVSYGFLQFTLGSGSLGRVLERYLAKSSTPTADALRRGYQQRVAQKDTTLREDARFKELLIAAAAEPVMIDAQFDSATLDYWDVVMKNYIQRRGNIRYPLSYALFFDMGVNFGVNHSFARRAEESLGVTPNTRTGENGITEEQLILRMAELRRDSHYKQAAEQGLGGLRVRADFWMNIVAVGDWYLQGDAGGFLEPKPGRKVQVRNP